MANVAKLDNDFTMLPSDIRVLLPINNAPTPKFNELSRDIFTTMP
jgi:hypothetical protein